MKIAVDKTTKKIVDILPDNATESNKFVVNNGYAFLEVTEDVFLVDGSFRDLTEDELSPIVSEENKNIRTQAVRNIEVEHQGIIYEGDETSQNRMSRAISGMEDGDTINWIAKDDSIQILTKTALKAILRKAGIEQTKLWVKGK